MSQKALTFCLAQFIHTSTPVKSMTSKSSEQKVKAPRWQLWLGQKTCEWEELGVGKAYIMTVTQASWAHVLEKRKERKELLGFQEVLVEIVWSGKLGKWHKSWIDRILVSTFPWGGYLEQCLRCHLGLLHWSAAVWVLALAPIQFPANRCPGRHQMMVQAVRFL